MNKKDFYVAMPTRAKEITNKDYDYKVIAFLQLHSNFVNYKDFGYDKNVLYGENYIYYSKLEFGGYKMKDNSTFGKKIAKMLKIDDSLITSEKLNGSLVYKIDYAKEGKYFITMHHDMLKELVIFTNSNVIKTYCVFCYVLANGSKQISNSKLRELTGIKSDNTMDVILKGLCKLGYIKRTLKQSDKVVVSKDETREINYKTKEYEYTLISYEEWQGKNSKA